MKKLYKYLLLSVFGLGFASCDFDTEVYQQLPSGKEYESVQDVQNGVNGAYYALGQYRFLGNNVIAYGDFCAGVSVGSHSTGHYANQSDWIVSEYDGELDEIWAYGYQVIDRATRTIIGGKDVLGKKDALHLSDADVANLNVYIAQSYALRALANYYLVNLFALPYHAGADNLGLPIIKDKPIEAFEQIKRATVGDTYTYIKDDIEQALAYYEQSGDAAGGVNAFYMNPGAIQALKARVAMDVADYTTAEAAAKAAIEWKGKGNADKDDVVPSNDIYVSMWRSLAITDEDIFTIAKTENDNLSANALNTLYFSYGGKIDENAKALYAETDIRLKLITEAEANKGGTNKYAGLPTSAATSNIPIFRKSEMSLMLAEIYARQDKLDNAKSYLFYTAKRNTALTIENLPNSKEDLLKFIADERVREFAGEGHRYYDARRTGETITVVGSVAFDIQKFVFPIPDGEVSSGFGVKQNEGWEDALPEE